MKITLAQIAPTLNREKNYRLHIEYIQSNISKSSMIIFPELSLSGYMLMDAIYEDAYKVEELKKFETLSLDIDLIIGCALWSESRIYNSAIYFSKGSIKHIHYKNTLPNYGMFEEKRYFFSGDILNSFDTKLGKSMVVICEDLWSSKNIDIIVKSKISILFVISASPTRGFEDNGLSIEDKWNSILKTTAILSGATIIYVNRVGFEDGLGFWGGSRVISGDGKIISRCKLFNEQSMHINIR